MQRDNRNWFNNFRSVHKEGGEYLGIHTRHLSIDGDTLCRSVLIRWHANVSILIGYGWYQGISEYFPDSWGAGTIIANQSLQNTEALHCFCRNPPDDCPVKGTMDLTQCVGAPLVASKPHFLDGHSSLTENVHGLSPNRKKHDVFMHFEIVWSNFMIPLPYVKFLNWTLFPDIGHPPLGC